MGSLTCSQKQLFLDQARLLQHGVSVKAPEGLGAAATSARSQRYAQQSLLQQSQLLSWPSLTTRRALFPAAIYSGAPNNRSQTVSHKIGPTHSHRSPQRAYLKICACMGGMGGVATGVHVHKRNHAALFRLTLNARVCTNHFEISKHDRGHDRKSPGPEEPITSMRQDQRMGEGSESGPEEGRGSWPTIASLCNGPKEGRKKAWTGRRPYGGCRGPNPLIITVTAVAICPHVWFPDMIPWPILLTCLVDAIIFMYIITVAATPEPTAPEARRSILDAECVYAQSTAANSHGIIGRDLVTCPK